MTQQQIAVVARWLKRRAQAVAVRWLTQQAQAVAVQRVDLERDRRARQARIARQARDTRGRWCRRASSASRLVEDGCFIGKGVCR